MVCVLVLLYLDLVFDFCWCGIFLFVIDEILEEIWLVINCWNEVLVSKEGILEVVEEELWILKLGDFLCMRLLGVGEGRRVFDFFGFKLEFFGIDLILICKFWNIGFELIFLSCFFFIFGVDVWVFKFVGFIFFEFLGGLGLVLGDMDNLVMVFCLEVKELFLG